MITLPAGSGLDKLANLFVCDMRNGGAADFMMTDALWNRQPDSGSQQGFILAVTEETKEPRTEHRASLIA